MGMEFFDVISASEPPPSASSHMQVSASLKMPIMAIRQKGCENIWELVRYRLFARLRWYWHRREGRNVQALSPPAAWQECKEGVDENLRI